LYDTRGGKYQSAGAVPAGTYKLVASLDGDASRTYVDGVDLSADTRWEVHCDTALRNCALRPARTP
jgi:hypothetical protein